MGNQIDSASAHLEALHCQLELVGQELADHQQELFEKAWLRRLELSGLTT